MSRTSGLAWRLIAPSSLPAGAGAEQSRRFRLSRAFASGAASGSRPTCGRISAAHLANFRSTCKEIVAQKRVRFELPEQLDEIIRGGPCVYCGLHICNWELVAYASKLMGCLSFTGAAHQRLSNPLVDEETRKLLAFLYDGGLLPKTPVTARALMKTAGSGGYPAFLADLRDDNGAAVPFFGKPALSTPFPALLARKAGLPLYAGCAACPASPTCASVIRAARVGGPRHRRPCGRRPRRDRRAVGAGRGLRSASSS